MSFTPSVRIWHKICMYVRNLGANIKQTNITCCGTTFNSIFQTKKVQNSCDLPCMHDISLKAAKFLKKRLNWRSFHKKFPIFQKSLAKRQRHIFSLLHPRPSSYKVKKEKKIKFERSLFKCKTHFKIAKNCIEYYNIIRRESIKNDRLMRFGTIIIMPWSAQPFILQSLLKFISKMFGIPNKWLRKAKLLFCWRRLGTPSVIKKNQNKDQL